jgi:hypothetical protein
MGFKPPYHRQHHPPSPLPQAPSHALECVPCITPSTTPQPSPATILQRQPAKVSLHRHPSTHRHAVPASLPSSDFGRSGFWLPLFRLSACDLTLVPAASVYLSAALGLYSCWVDRTSALAISPSLIATYPPLRVPLLASGPAESPPNPAATNAKDIRDIDPLLPASSPDPSQLRPVLTGLSILLTVTSPLRPGRQHSSSQNHIP